MTGREDVFQEAMDRGHSAAWDQQWERAEGFYRQALEEFPENVTALTSLGLALYELRSFGEALNTYIQVAKIAPADPLPLEKISHIYSILDNPKYAQAAAARAADIYLRNNEVNKAIANFRFIVNINPGNLGAHTRLAQILEKLGKKEEAVTEYLAMASLLRKGNQVERAVQAANRALQILPGSMEAMDALALLRDYKSLPMPEVYRQTAQKKEKPVPLQLEAPIPTDDSRVDLDPVSEARQKALSVMASVLFEEAEEGEDLAIERTGFKSIVRNTGKLMASNVDRSRIVLHVSQVIDLQTKGNVSQAAEELEHAIKAGMDNSAAYFDLGLLRYLGGNYEEAQRHLKYAFQHPDFALGAHLVLGQTLAKMDMIKEASLEYIEALRLAEAEGLSEDQVEMLDRLYDPLIESQRLEADPQMHKQVYKNIGGLLVNPGWRQNLERAREELPTSDGDHLVSIAEIVVQAQSSRIVETVTRVSELERAGHLRAAMEEAFYAIQFAPNYLPLHQQMAGLLLSQGQTQEAIDKLHVIARSYSTRGELRRAVDIYRQLIELAPLDLEPRKKIIELLILQGQIEEATEEYIALAEVYYNLADLEKARETYVEALQMVSQTDLDLAWRVRILHYMADIDMQSLDWRQGIQVFEQIRAIRPEDKKARQNLIDINFRLGQEQKALAELDNYCTFLMKSGAMDKAVKFLEELARENPRRYPVRRRLVAAYKQVGRVDDAISELDAIGDILVEAGNVVGAIKTIEEILALNPPNVGDYQKVLETLKRGD